MGLILVLEDVRRSAEKLVLGLKSDATSSGIKNVEASWVPYKNNNGRIIDSSSVSKSAAERSIVSALPTVFLIDLSPEGLEQNPNTSYGLSIVKDLASELNQESVEQLLQNPNYLVAILTHYDGWTDAKSDTWKAVDYLKYINLVHVQSSATVESVLDTKLLNPTLPYFLKIRDDRLVTQLVITWLRQFED